MSIIYLAQLTHWLKKPLGFFIDYLSKNKIRKVAKHRKILEFDFKIAKNKVFINIIIILNNFLLEKDDTNI